jgi:hypothetical protein
MGGRFRGGTLAGVSDQDPQHRPPPYCTAVAGELEADGEAADAVTGDP